MIPGSKYCDDLIPALIAIDFILVLIAIDSMPGSRHQSRSIGHGIKLIDRDCDQFDPGKTTQSRERSNTIDLTPRTDRLRSIRSPFLSRSTQSRDRSRSIAIDPSIECNRFDLGIDQFDPDQSRIKIHGLITIAIDLIPGLIAIDMIPGLKYCDDLIRRLIAIDLILALTRGGGEA